MSVPPSNRRSSSTPPSKGRPDDEENQTGKEFKLPPKKYVGEKDGDKEKDKEKGLFDLAGKEAVMKEKQQDLSGDLKIESKKSEAVKAADAVAQVTRVAKLVQDMVETMHIGQIDAKNIASLNLKQSPEVPQAFAGSNLTLSYENNGLTIHFDNFMSPQQQNTAITLVEKNKEQLEQMIQVLSAKNIQVTEFSIGEHTVALPRVIPLPPPFQAPATAQTESEQQRRGGGEQEGREGEGGEPR